jgi:hypothetical protein
LEREGHGPFSQYRTVESTEPEVAVTARYRF